jgi:hypothetical protein
VAFQPVGHQQEFPMVSSPVWHKGHRAGLINCKSEPNSSLAQHTCADSHSFSVPGFAYTTFCCFALLNLTAFHWTQNPLPLSRAAKDCIPPSRNSSTAFLSLYALPVTQSATNGWTGLQSRCLLVTGHCLAQSCSTRQIYDRVSDQITMECYPF